MRMQTALSDGRASKRKGKAESIRGNSSASSPARIILDLGFMLNSDADADADADADVDADADSGRERGKEVGWLVGWLVGCFVRPRAGAGTAPIPL